METSQEQNFFSPTNQQNSTSNQEDQIIIRLSSSSSSSSCSSIEAEPNPHEQNLNNNYEEQSPPTQIMERSTNNTTTNTEQPYRIPSRVFARTPSTAPAEWSTLSNESTFSIHMGNNSFTGIDFFKSGELTFPQPPSPMAPPPPPLPSPQVVVVEEAKTPVDIAKKAAETDKAYRASKEDEQKAAASIREVIMANEAAATKENNKVNRLDRSVSRRSEDLSVKSFAFQTLGNADLPKKQRPETPKISTKDESFKKEEATTTTTTTKPVTTKAEASNRNPNWLSCFPCCTTFFV